MLLLLRFFCHSKRKCSVFQTKVSNLYKMFRLLLKHFQQNIYWKWMKSCTNIYGGIYSHLPNANVNHNIHLSFALHEKRSTEYLLKSYKAYNMCVYEKQKLMEWNALLHFISLSSWSFFRWFATATQNYRVEENEMLKLQ